MHKIKRWILILALILFILLFIYILLTFKFLDFFVDLWWFESIGYKGFFIQRLLYRYAAFTGVALIFFVVFIFNFKLASKLLGKSHKSSSEKKPGGLVNMLKAGSLKLFAPISIILAVPIAIPFYEEWEKALLFIFGKHTGIRDEIFGKDISYYLFSYPVYRLVQNELLMCFLILFLAVVVLYWVVNRMTGDKGRKFSTGAKVHITILFSVTVILQIWGYILKRYDLLYNSSHEPLFFGPGFLNIWINLPFIWLSVVFLALTALSIILYTFRKKGFKFIIISAAGLIFATWGIYSPLLPEFLDKYYVKPNEIIHEKPYLEANITATLKAYGLDHVEMLEYSVDAVQEIRSNADVMKSLRNIPVWDRSLLDDVYKQLQGIHPYYEFPSVDVDRYNVSGRYQQVYLGAREFDFENVPAYARNWPNMHLQYTHGYGAVMTPAAQGGDELMTWFMMDMPVKSDFGFKIETPGIYFGLGRYEYIIAPNEIGEIDHLQGEKNIMSSYEGKGGIPISSFFRKLLFSVHFRDRNIFFTSKTAKDSRILFRRNIVNRIKKVTPFFHLDRDPYLVVTSKGLFWIQDAYTVSDRYPNVKAFNEEYNYIRNSVKIVVDAYNGSIDYYAASSDDPFILAYQHIYSGLIKPIEKMPAELRRHLRYPKDLFETQLRVYGEYHQVNPEMFYRREDNWELPKLIKGDLKIPSKPYYLTLNLLNRNKDEFLLLCPMTPTGRNNLRALAVAGCDGENYGKIFMINFPKGKQVYGPSQINTLIDQDTEIAQQLTLWDQAGSEVIRGRMIILPVGNLILYIQPVYLSSASRLKIPELKRIIVSNGDIAVMEISLEEAITRLEKRIQSRMEIRKQRFPVNTPVNTIDGDSHDTK